MDHGRHFTGVNSDVILYWTVSSNPIAMPIKNRRTVNIIQDTENADNKLNRARESKAKNSGFLRPKRSAT